jgi:autotransporter-associated beta strand protein
MNIIWKGTTGNYTLPSNWVGHVLPGSADTGVFNAAGKTKSIKIAATEAVGGWTFTSGGYTVTMTGVAPSQLAFDGAGIAGSPQIVFDETGTLMTGTINFNNNSTAGHATIRMVTGGINFNGDSDGGNARLIVGAKGAADLFGNGPGGGHVFHIGSIEGAGQLSVISGIHNFVVGSNNLSTVSSGSIEDGGTCSLTKVGTGTLTFTGTGAFAGGYVINRGTLAFDTKYANYTPSITFAANAAIKTLALGNASFMSHDFAPAIDGFAKPDVLDLSGLTFHHGATAVYHSGTGALVVHSGTVTDTLLLDSPAGTHFIAASDGHGGTKVTLAPPHVAAVASTDHVGDYLFAA